MSSHLISFVSNQIEWIHSEKSDSITLSGLDVSNVRRTRVGMGIFYIYGGDRGKYAGGRLCELAISEETPVSVSSPGQLWTRITLDEVVRIPCTGILASSELGYLRAPTVRVEVSEGKNIAMMLISPRMATYQISAGKQALSLPSEEANLVLSCETGQLWCSGTISGSKFGSASLVLNRNPHLPTYRAGYDEELAKLNGPGEISVRWKPVAKSFEDCLFVFYPSTITAPEFTEVASWLGVPETDILSPNASTVIGDGPGTDYTLRLVLHRQFRKSLSDETRILVS